MSWVSRRYKTMQVFFDIPEEFEQYIESGYKPKWNNGLNIDRATMLIDLTKRVGVDKIKELDLTNIHDSWKLWQYARYACDKYDETNKKFQEYVLANPWVKRYYEDCVRRGFYYHDPLMSAKYSWTHVQNNDITAINNFLSDLSLKNFLYCHDRRRLAVYNEMQRPVPFVAGNLVMLRSPFHDKRLHDPFYHKGAELKNEPRIGIVLEILDKTHPDSYSGKGTRLVTVQWSATNEKGEHSINSLKLVNRKDKFIGKLVERTYDVEDSNPES